MAELRFGFVSEEIIDGLQTYGNWKVRQNAIDELLKSIDALTLSNDVISEMSPFIEFLFSLIDDPNFKIKQGSLETINALIKKLGSETINYLKIFSTKLVERLTDPKIYVKEGCLSAFNQLLEIVGPIKLFLALKHSVKSEHHAIRQEIIFLYLMILFITQEHFDHFLVTLAFDAFKEALLDSSGNVAGYAIEGLLFLKSKLPPNEFQALLSDGSKLPDSILSKLHRCLEGKSPTAVLNERGFVELKDVPSFYPTEEEDHSKEEISTNSLRSHPLQLRKQSASQEVSISGSSETEACVIHNTSLETVQSVSKQDRRAEIISVEKSRDSTTSFDRGSSQNVAARIDRIAKLLRRRDESALPTETIQTSKSATMSVKRRENLNLLRMKQRDRRTHSANAILQRKDVRSKAAVVVYDQNHELLPNIHRTPHLNNSCQVLEHRKSLQEEKDGELFDSEKETGILGFIKARRFKSRRFSRKRGELNKEKVQMTRMEETVSIPTTVFLPEDDRGYDSPGCASLPASTIQTRPGTYASGTSISPKTTNFDITTTEPFIDAEAVAHSVVERLRIANNTRKKEMDWLSQAEALTDARRLVFHHPDVIKKLMRDFVLAFVPALQQLRSTTSRTAITLCQELFENLGDAMDHDLEDIVPLLLKKAGETSNAGIFNPSFFLSCLLREDGVEIGRDTFLASEADRALSVMIRNVSMTRALHILLQTANHSSKYIRSKVAAHLDDCLALAATKLKASANLSLIDRVFKTGVGFLEEGYQQTRTYGKRILWELKQWVNNKGAFERLVGQIEPDSKKRRVLEVTQRAEGPPPAPLRSSLSQTRRRHSSSSLTPLTPSLLPPSRVARTDLLNGCASPIAPAEEQYFNDLGGQQRRRSSPGDCSVNGDVQVCKVLRPPKPMNRKPRQQSGGHVSFPEPFESVTEILNKVNAKDWRERIKALEQLREAVQRVRHFKENELLNVIDQLTHRLTDGNSKVVLVTLETLRVVLDKSEDRANLCLNTVVPSVVSNLASSIEKIRSAAEDVLDQLVERMDPTSLVQIFSQCCSHGNPRTKAFLLQKLQELTKEVHTRKPQFVVKYILPVAFSSLADVRVDIREANAELVRDLAQIIGHTFVEKAETLTGANRQKLFDILHEVF